MSIDDLKSLTNKHRDEMIKIIDNQNRIQKNQPNKNDPEKNNEVTLCNKKVKFERMVDLHKQGKIPGEFILFLKDDAKYGFLKVTTYLSTTSSPIENVKVTISKSFSDYTYVFCVGFTDKSGSIDKITLPCPDKILSQKPSEKLPYAVYDLLAEHPNFHQAIPINPIIFDGITSVQLVEMLPNEKK